MDLSFILGGRPCQIDCDATTIENNNPEISANPVVPTAASIHNGGNPMSSDRSNKQQTPDDVKGGMKQPTIGQDDIIHDGIGSDEASNPAPSIIPPHRIEGIGDPIEALIPHRARNDLPADSGDADAAGEEDGIGHEENP